MIDTSGTNPPRQNFLHEKEEEKNLTLVPLKLKSKKQFKLLTMNALKKHPDIVSIIQTFYSNLTWLAYLCARDKILWVQTTL